MSHRIICCWTCKHSKCLSEDKMCCAFKIQPVQANHVCDRWEDGGTE